MKKVTKNNVSDHVDDLIGYSEKIEVGKITILTGSNGSGKSFIRKMLGFKIADKNNGLKVASTSMEKRAGLNMDGAMGAFLKDCDWTPTSIETYKLIRGLLGQEDRYLVIDEPEIGMGEETVLGLINYLNENLNKTSHGVTIITHSRLIVQHLKHDLFINIDGLDREQWLSREIKPIDKDLLEKQSDIIFREIQDRINKKLKEN